MRPLAVTDRPATQMMIGRITDHDDRMRHRPLGGVLLGHLGDRWGRKVVTTLALCLSGVATVGMGLIPPYKV
jgi:hypothetical protein